MMFAPVITQKRKMEGRMYDGQTDGLTDDQRETIILCHYCVAGYNKTASNTPCPATQGHIPYALL